jgi:hypothetical protein
MKNNWCYELIWNVNLSKIVDFKYLNPDTVTYSQFDNLFYQYQNDITFRRILSTAQICRPDNLNLKIIYQYSNRNIPAEIMCELREEKLKRILCLD